MPKRPLNGLELRSIAARKPVSAFDWLGGHERGAADLEDILSERRWAAVWDRHRRGEATGLELLDAYMAARVPRSSTARLAHIREAENLARELGDTHFLRTLAAWRLREQRGDHHRESDDDKSR